LNFRGASIEEIFNNVRGLGVLKEESMAVEEFYAVFISIDFKIDRQ
jgi:hypothetical protein